MCQDRHQAFSLKPWQEFTLQYFTLLYLIRHPYFTFKALFILLTKRPTLFIYVTNTHNSFLFLPSLAVYCSTINLKKRSLSPKSKPQIPRTLHLPTHVSIRSLTLFYHFAVFARLKDQAPILYTSLQFNEPLPWTNIRCIFQSYSRDALSEMSQKR